jgi:ABC-type uncharacterized transport system involved in gliding motility auxiliary subunit
MKTDSTWRAANFVWLRLRYNSNVDVGFSNNGDFHFKKIWPKLENFCDNFDFTIIFCYFVPSNQRVMGQQNKKRRRRNYKYHAITFKLSSGQYRSLRNYCKARKTTPIKLIKRNIERFITAYEYEVPTDIYLTENQLELFSEN